MAAKFTIFGSDTCRACDNVKTILSMKNLEFDFINVNDSVDNMNTFRIFYPTEREIPQVRYDGEHIAGGLRQFREYLTSVGL